MFNNILKKSFSEYVIILLIALIFVVFFYIIMNLISSNDKHENMIMISQSFPIWSRNQCDFSMNQTMLDELKNNNFIQSDSNWNVYFPCGYDEVTKEVSQMPIVNGGKYFILENCDEIVAKDLLWRNVLSYYGTNKSKTLLPSSYILYDINDLSRFKIDYDKSKLYIMKKNIQRQEGLKITNDLEEILSGFASGYVVVQELLQDPYIISGRKTNMRFYVLVVCRGIEYDVFVFRDGFMYYTKDLFKPGSTEEGPNITTGYLDRQIYIDNPLTHDDLRAYLDDPLRTNLTQSEINIRNQGLRVSEVYFNRIYHMLREVFMAFAGKLQGDPTKRKFNDTIVSFQIFGVDVAMNDELNPIVIEVNKGPDLGAKDERDSEVKHTLIRDMFKVVGLIDGQSYLDTNFVQVLDINKNAEINADEASGCNV